MNEHSCNSKLKTVLNQWVLTGSVFSAPQCHLPSGAHWGKGWPVTCMSRAIDEGLLNIVHYSTAIVFNPWNFMDCRCQAFPVLHHLLELLKLGLTYSSEGLSLKLKLHTWPPDAKS